MTREDFEAILMAETPGTPATVAINPDKDFEVVLSTATQSRGTESWVPLDLAPGTYVLVCFFPDIEDGIPHAFKGMYNVIDVAE